MTDQNCNCRPDCIELFLRQQLSDLEQAAFEAHLDHCARCRQALETHAARKEVWAAVRESLGNEVEAAGRLLQCGTAALAGSAAAHTDRQPSGSAANDLFLEGEVAAPLIDSVLHLLAPTDDPRMLGRLGTYEIVGVVGQGGMGVVLKGLDTALNRYVAIKALAPHLAASGSARQRFAREAQAAAAVTHENVVAIHGVAECHGLPYLVMPYVRGESLQKRLDRRGPLGVSEVLRIGRQVAAGLAAAHAQGLVHRDIKPANVLLEDGVERLKITDFGLARAVDDASLTRTGVIAGTPQYMSPEQARGEPIDARSDLFSLGSVLYALCTGRPPFRAETTYGILRRITDTEPRAIREINSAIPEWLAAIIGKLLEKAPGERWASALELAELLEQCLAHVQQPSAVPLPRACRVKRAPRWDVRRRATMAAIAIFAAGTGFALYEHWPRSAGPLTGSMDASSPAASSAPAPITRGTIPADTLTGWDDTAQPIDDLLRDGAAFESRAGHVWNREQVLPLNPLETTPPESSAQESEP